MRVLIIGGDKQGQSIANQLLAKDGVRTMFRSTEHQITFIEEDESLCEELERQFSAPIFQGDGTRQTLFEQVGIRNIDVAIAASQDDDRNVVAALQARQLGVEKVIAVVQQSDYTQLLEEKGIAAISVPRATAAILDTKVFEKTHVSGSPIGDLRV